MSKGLKRARATRKPAKLPYRVVESDDGEFGDLFSIVPSRADDLLVWDEEHKLTARNVCRALNRAYRRGVRDAEKPKS
jgi:hypothetical protein